MTYPLRGLWQEVVAWRNIGWCARARVYTWAGGGGGGGGRARPSARRQWARFSHTHARGLAVGRNPGIGGSVCAGWWVWCTWCSFTGHLSGRWYGSGPRSSLSTYSFTAFSSCSWIAPIGDLCAGVRVCGCAGVRACACASVRLCTKGSVGVVSTVLRHVRGRRLLLALMGARNRACLLCRSSSSSRSSSRAWPLWFPVAKTCEGPEVCNFENSSSFCLPSYFL